MEEINIKDLFKFYLNKSLIIIFITLLFTIFGYYYNEYIQIPMYNGTTTIILVQNNNKTNYDLTQGVTLNEKLLSTYTEIIKSRSVLEPVIEKLNLNTTLEDLKEQISVTELSTSIIEITVSDKDNEKAATIANNIAEKFKEEISIIYKLENVSVLDEAIPEEEPHNVHKTKQLIIFMAIGIIISSTIIFIAYYFDNTIKDKKDIEQYLNIPVLGEIPSSPKLLNYKNRRNKGSEK